MESQKSKNSTHEQLLTRPKCEFLSQLKRQAIREALDHWYVSQQYQNEKEEITEGSGVCKACQASTSHKCETCTDYYCINDCQHPNWKKHEAKCNALSPSEPKTPTPVKHTKEDEKLMISTSPSPFRKLTQQVHSTPLSATSSKVSGRKSEPAMGKHLTKFRHPDEPRKCNRTGKNSKSDKRLSLSDSDSKSKEYSDQKKRSTGKKSHNKTFPLGASSSGDNESLSNSIFSKMSKSDAKIRTSKRNIEQTEPKKVVFFYKDPDRPFHWVMDEDDVKEFESILNTLAENCDGYEPIEPELGLICGCQYEDEWYRARVFALEPKLTVHYIDYGNTLEDPPTPLKKLPPEIRMIKNLVYRIEFDKGTPDKYKDSDLSGKTLEVKTMYFTKSGVEVVQLVSGDPKSTDSATTEDDTKELVTKMKLIRFGGAAINLVEIDSKGIISFLPTTSYIRFGSIIPAGKEKEVEADVKESKNLDLIELKSFKAADGDYVLVIDYNGERRRGKVISTLCSTYYVSLIDYGIVIPVENVYKLPGKRQNLNHLGVMVTINDILSSRKVKNMMKAVYKVTGKQDSEGKWPCEFKQTSSEEVIARGYIQYPPEEGVTIPLCIPLESGVLCEISVVTGVKTCYVRPLDEQAARKSLEMSVKMSEFLIQVDPLTEAPEVGKMYASKNKKDDCFHRAVVKSVKNGKFEVLFVDYGTVEEVEMKDLKPLPITIKVVPFFAVEVTLSGITVESLSDSAKNYLDKLIEKNCILVLSFVEGESDDVVLKEQGTGVVVNEVIEKQEIPRNVEDEEGEGEEVDERLHDIEDIDDIEDDYDVDNDDEDDEDDDDVDDGDEMENLVKEEDFGDKIIEDWDACEVINLPEEDEGVVMKGELKRPTVCVNKKYDLVLQYIEEREFFSTLTFWMANMEDDIISQYSGEMIQKIEDYCELHNPYRPKEQEVCLALYEDYWYRAVALSVTDNNYEVFFVDYGNVSTLTPEGIRKMPRELAKCPIWAFKSTISGMGKLIGKPNLKKKVYDALKCQINSVLKDVTVSKYEFDIYYLSIPEIEKILSI